MTTLSGEEPAKRTNQQAEIALTCGDARNGSHRFKRFDVARMIEADWVRTGPQGRVVALAERTFKAWTRDSAITLGGEDKASVQLFAAAMSANHLRDHGSWRHISGLLGQAALLRLGREAEPEAARTGLDTLRLAGDEAALKLAVRRLVANGPATAVTLAAADIRLDAATRTTGPANLALLRYGGDVLDEATAERTLRCF